MRATTSAPNPPVCGASCTMTARPVRITLSHTVCSSNGVRVRKSITSTLYPYSAAVSAAASAIGTVGP